MVELLGHSASQRPGAKRTTCETRPPAACSRRTVRSTSPRYVTPDFRHSVVAQAKPPGGIALSAERLASVDDLASQLSVRSHRRSRQLPRDCRKSERCGLLSDQDHYLRFTWRSAVLAAERAAQQSSLSPIRTAHCASKYCTLPAMPRSPGNGLFRESFVVGLARQRRTRNDQGRDRPSLGKR
jgi:hypothetical protein